MGFLDFLFSGKSEVKSLRTDIEKELETLRREIRERSASAQKETGEILSVIASLENEIESLKEDSGQKGKPGKLEATTERRLSALEKMAEALKVAGKLSLQNHESIISIESSLKRLDALQKALREHIEQTPEVIISNDEYSEELLELRRRLDALENKELIILGPQKKKQKRRR